MEITLATPPVAIEETTSIIVWGGNRLFSRLELDIGSLPFSKSLSLESSQVDPGTDLSAPLESPAFQVCGYIGLRFNLTTSDSDQVSNCGVIVYRMTARSGRK